jgi:formylmethanofuran dehydrogenase subunit E
MIMNFRRLSHKEELDIMSNETNATNMRRLQDLMTNHFFLKNDSSNLIHEFFESGFNNVDNWHSINRKLELNEQQRAFFAIEKSAETDKGFKFYCEQLQATQDRGEVDVWNVRHYFLNEEDERKGRAAAKLIRANHNQLFAYSTFNRGRIKIDKQEFKLFKWLLSKKILQRHQVEQITTSRQASADETIVMVSHNPVDIIMASTGQSFGSCVSFDSDYESCYYLGFPGVVIDPNKIIVAILNHKRIKTTLLGNADLKHFSYNSRTYVLWMKDKDESNKEQLHVVCPYPYSSLSYEDILDQLYGDRFTDVDDSIRDNYEGMFEFPRLVWSDNCTCNTYLDSYGIRTDRGNNTCAWDGDYSGGSFGDFNNTGGYNSLWDGDPWSDSDMPCEYCGDYYCEDDLTYVSGHGSVCYWCYENAFTSCERCGEMELNRDIETTEDDAYLCDRCFSNYTTKCDKCGEIYYNRDELTDTDDDHSLCDDCYDSITPCADCGNVYLWDSEEDLLTGDNVCAYCLHKREKKRSK